MGAFLMTNEYESELACDLERAWRAGPMEAMLSRIFSAQQVLRGEL